MSEMNERIESIRYNISDAIKKSHREINSVQLMAVSKNHTFNEIEHALQCGITLYGENKVQELSEKFPVSHSHFSLHMIGHLQTNKVKKVLPYVDSIDSVDSLKLGLKIDNEASLIKKCVSILLEINTSNEEAKSGFVDMNDLYHFIDTSESFTNSTIKGLMTVGPLSDDEKAIRESFSKLNKIQEDLKRRYPNLDFSTLSMGMSGDYRIAIEMGSTLVRIGTAIFGSRGY